MARATVVIVDRDENRRRTMSTLISSAAGVDIFAIPALSEDTPGFGPETRLILCPWNEGGESLVDARRSTAPPSAALIVLSEVITPDRIAACSRAGGVHLIPSKPLNLNALRTRMLLSLEGPATLAERLSRPCAAMRDAVALFPALRRRLARP